MSPNSSELLLQLLQQFIKHRIQFNQIHAQLICTSSLNRDPLSKWKPTQFYNTLMRGYLSFGHSHQSFRLFKLMLSRQISPNAHSFPPLIKSAGLCSNFRGSVSIYGQGLRRGVLIDPFVQTSLIGMYSLFGDGVSARKVFDEMTSPGVFEYNAMVDAYAKNGDMGAAVSMFGTMARRDVVTWTSVINGFAKNGLFHEAIEFFRDMVVGDDVVCGFVRPNEATYVSVLSSCANLDHGGLCIGKQVHGYMVRNELVSTVFMGTALVDLYGKLGSLNQAVLVFNRMVDKQVCSWNALISAFANNGREEEAMGMFEKMKDEGLRPNEVTFVALLTACARAKLVEVGFNVFQSMRNDFGVMPRMEHYGCLVDLLGRAGMLGEASDFVNRMPCEPDGSVLGALLSSCTIHGEMRLGNEVGKKLVDLQPQYSGRYVALSNINAWAGRWDLAAYTRKGMVDAGIQKIAAYSWNDVK
ncbi:Putative pentatricopeptide repeat-containing protein At1g10330 [Linum perenne]